LASLDLWRKWGTFSEDEIARMTEAEFISDLYILILQGVTEKSQVTLGRFYEHYDAHFKERDRVERRLNSILTALDNVFGDKMKESQLSGRIVLYALVVALYDILFGLGSPLVTFTSKTKIDNFENKLDRLSNKLKNREKLPEDVQDALLSRPCSKLNRAVLTSFTKKILSMP
jgi:hypothetical protein